MSNELNVDSEIWGAKKASFDPSPFNYAPTYRDSNQKPMEVGNIPGTTSSTSHREQSRKELQQRTCSKGHEAVCRLWRCGQETNNNTEVKLEIQEDTIEASSKN